MFESVGCLHVRQQRGRGKKNKCSDSTVVYQEDGVLSDSAADISVVEDAYSAGEERASTSVTAVIVSVSDGGRVSLHVRESSPGSKRKIAHARGVMNKVKRIDLCTHSSCDSKRCMFRPLISILLIGCRLLYPMCFVSMS